MCCVKENNVVSFSLKEILETCISGTALGEEARVVYEYVTYPSLYIFLLLVWLELVDILEF